MDVLGARSRTASGCVETIVGLSILAFGLLGIAAAFSQGMRSLGGSNYDILAREKAVEAIETVYSARDTKTITWAEIRNVQGETGHDGGVFLDGPHPLTSPATTDSSTPRTTPRSSKRWCSRASTNSSAPATTSFSRSPASPVRFRSSSSAPRCDSCGWPCAITSEQRREST